MPIRDIVNRDIVNLTNCEHEPIHVPGSIQPHGFLLGLKEAGLIIDYCSSNSLQFLGVAHEQLLGKSFEMVFGQAETERFRSYVASEAGTFSAPLHITFDRTHFSCVVQKTPAILVV